MKKSILDKLQPRVNFCDRMSSQRNISLSASTAQTKPLFNPSTQQKIATACQEFDVKELYAFGSVANGSSNSKSDIDLLVDFKPIGTKGAFVRYMDFKSRMESILKCPVDLVTNKRFRNPYFQQAVDQEKKRIYAA